MKRGGLLLALVLVLVVAGCGFTRGATAPTDNVGLFMTRILREELSGQWAQQWTELHPGHQKLITREQYVACSRALATNIGTGRETFRVLAVSDDPIHVFGVPQHLSKLVTISFHSPDYGATSTYKLHAVRVAGRWRWILGGRFLSAVMRGRCLDGSPLLKRAPSSHAPS